MHRAIIAGLGILAGLGASFAQTPSNVGPTEAEALAAYREAYARNPLAERGAENKLTIALGACEKSGDGPGVSCMISIKHRPEARPIDRVISFSKTASGAWAASSF